MRELIFKIANEAGSMTVGEKFIGGILITLFSMLMVFAVLILLMYVIKILGTTLGGNAKPAKTTVEKSQNESSSKENISEVQARDEAEVVAAIIAAVNAVKTGEDSKIIIRQIVKNQNNWAENGLAAQVNSRL